VRDLKLQEIKKPLNRYKSQHNFKSINFANDIFNRTIENFNLNSVNDLHRTLKQNQKSRIQSA